jgi:hypothetical protein
MEDTLMKNTVQLLALGLVLSSSAVFACSEDGKDGILPENDFYIPVGAKNLNGGLSEEQFNTVIDNVETIYEPIVRSSGGKLDIERKWKDGTVNAYAQRAGKTWKVSMFGGLARHESITADGFALVVCHEIGHHIGGAPKKGGSGGGWWGGGAGGWAANEGQSDYFATLKCLRKVFLNDDNATVVATLNAPKALSDKCLSVHKSDLADTNICIRVGMAGMSVAKLFQSLRNQTTPPAFETPDTKVVAKTDDNHPATQCRLDTYFAGAACEVADSSEVSQADEVTGTCHSKNGHKDGLRPLCWFKPTK